MIAKSEAGRASAVRRYKLLVFSNPLPGAEPEFNRWYNEDHIRDCLRTPGFKSVQRYRLADIQQPNQAFVESAPSWRYCAAWEVETDDLNAFWAGVNREIDAGRMGISDTIINVSAWIFEDITPTHAASGQLAAVGQGK